MGLHRAYMHASLGFFVSWQCLICNRPPARRHRFRSLLLWNKVSHDFSLSPFVLLSLVVLCPNTRRSHQRFFFFFFTAWSRKTSFVHRREANKPNRSVDAAGFVLSERKKGFKVFQVNFRYRCHFWNWLKHLNWISLHVLSFWLYFLLCSEQTNYVSLFSSVR